MGNRLSRIYTRTGDDGSTGLGDGTRVAKDHPRVEAYGSVDELNSAIGVVLSCDELPAEVREVLVEVQHQLFDLGGELCIPGHQMITDDYVARTERCLDVFNADLPPLKDFVLPGGGRAAAATHLARAVCRRAERRVWTLSSMEPVNPQVARYLDRPSDMMCVIARVLGRRETGQEVLWRHDRVA